MDIPSGHTGAGPIPDIPSLRGHPGIKHRFPDNPDERIIIRITRLIRVSVRLSTTPSEAMRKVLAMADWKQIPGALVRISAGSRTNVWGVNAGGNIYRHTNNDASPWV